MNSGQDHQVTTPYHVNSSLNSWKESVTLTMVNQESVFKYQLEELHRIYKKQVQLMEEIGIAQSHGQLKYTRKRSKKPKLTLEEKPVNSNEVTRVDFQLGRDTDAPVTPETANRITTRGKQVLQEDKHATSAAETLLAMSSSSSSSSLVRASSDRLVWFAKIVTSVKRNADLASSQRKTCRSTQKEMKMPGQHGERKREGTHVGPCIRSWGEIRNGQRSERIRASNPLYTFQRGALLSRWR